MNNEILCWYRLYDGVMSTVYFVSVIIFYIIFSNFDIIAMFVLLDTISMLALCNFAMFHHAECRYLA